MRPEDKNFTFRLPVTMLDALHVLADADDRTVAQVVRRILGSFLAEQQQKGAAQ